MKHSSHLLIEPVTDSSSRLSIPRFMWGWSIPGVVLEDQYQIDQFRFLAITSDNCPYEECLHILLLALGRKDYERVDLAGEVLPGIYSNGRMISASTFEFQFFGSDRFRVDVARRPRLMLRQFLAGPGIKYMAPLRRKALTVTRLVEVGEEPSET